MKPVMTRHDVFSAIEDEADYQDSKWGEGKEQSLAGYFLIMEQKLNDAKTAWMKDSTGRKSPLAELLKVVTVGVRALEQYGEVGNVLTKNEVAVNEFDIPETLGLLSVTDAVTKSHYCIEAKTIKAATRIDPNDPELGSVLLIPIPQSPSIVRRMSVRETIEQILGGQVDA